MPKEKTPRKIRDKERKRKRKIWAIEYLGGVCVKCGTTDNLEFDHIEPSTKLYTITRDMIGYSLDKLSLELDKCQLLCNPCHKIKTAQDRHNKAPKPINHGNVSGYARGCRCDECRQAHTEYNIIVRDKAQSSECIPHGTRSGYKHYGCRCDACTSAHREYNQDTSRKNKEICKNDPSKLKHGSASTYSNYGCRCEPCSKAMSDKGKARQKRKQKST